MKASQIAVRNFDGAFNYDLSFSLFNGNGTFKISAEKLDISLQNATSDKDWEIIQDCIAKIFEHVPLPEISHTIFSATAHATFPSIEAMQQYLLRFAVGNVRSVVENAVGGLAAERTSLAVNKKNHQTPQTPEKKEHELAGGSQPQIV